MTFGQCGPRLCACCCWLHCFEKAIASDSARLSSHGPVRHRDEKKRSRLRAFGFCPNQLGCYCNSGTPFGRRPFDLHCGKLKKQGSFEMIDFAEIGTAVRHLERRTVCGFGCLNYFSYSMHRTGFEYLRGHSSGPPIELPDFHYSPCFTNLTRL